MVRVRVRLGYTMAICLVLATPSKPRKMAYLWKQLLDNSEQFRSGCTGKAYRDTDLQGVSEPHFPVEPQ